MHREAKEAVPPKLNRAAYIAQVFSWRDSVLGHYAQKAGELNAASTHAGLMAVAWDFAQFDASDPRVTVICALSVPD